MIMKKRWIKRIILGIIIIVVWAGISSHKELPAVTTTEVKKGPLKISVISRGKVAPTKEHRIKSKVDGVIQDINVSDSDTVREGEILLKLDKTQLLVRLEQLKKDMLYKTLDIEQTKARFIEAELTLQDAQRKYESYKRLYELKAISKKELENIYLQYQQARVRYESAAEELKTKKKVEKDAEQEWVKEQLAWTEVKAPISGMVIKIGEEIKEGLPITTGTYLFTIINPSAYQIKALVDEVDFRKIHIGQKAKIKIDAYPKQVIGGEIIKISSSPIISYGSGIKSFEITLKIDAHHLELFTDMQCDVEISTEIIDAVKIPLEAIIESDDKRYIFTVKDGMATKRKIHTGLESVMESEVISGVKENEIIILNPPSTLKDGEKVIIAK